MIEPDIAEPETPITTRTLRQFAGLWLVFFAALACWQGLWRDRWGWATFLALCGLIAGPWGLVRPEAIRPLFQGCMAVAGLIGAVVSYLVLAVIYFLVLGPIALVFRLIGRDALQLRPRPGLETYLQPKSLPTDPRSYLRPS